MLEAVTDRLLRQRQDSDVLADVRRGCGQDAPVDQEIRAERQMGSVLFDSGDRKQRDRGLPVEVAEVRCLEVLPVSKHARVSTVIEIIRGWRRRRQQHGGDQGQDRDGNDVEWLDRVP